MSKPQTSLITWSKTLIYTSRYKEVNCT